MYRRVLIWSLVTLVVLSFASFGTARARQIAGVNDAQSRLNLSRAAVMATLTRASADGLTVGELRPYRRAARRLSDATRPAAMPLWDPVGAKFYDRQNASYRRLSAHVRTAEARIATKSKGAASVSLGELAHAINTAASLDLDVYAANKSLADGRTALSAGTTVRSIRHVASSIASARAALVAPIQSGLQKVHAVLSMSGGSITGVRALADNETQVAQQSLGLLGLLTPRAQVYGSTLIRLNHVVHTQQTAFQAAVKEGPLHLEAERIAADYAKTVPAKMIVVSTEDQHVDMYDGSSIVYSSDVTTGGPELPTDHGIFHIYFKASPFVFHSPWPVGSPFYYNPTPVQFWMPFDGAEGLHDASWRSNFGPGSNLAPTDLGTGNTILGTHGCVNLPAAAAQFIWDWAPVGTTVVVI